MPGPRFGLAVLAGVMLLMPQPARATAPVVVTAHLQGEINSVTASYIEKVVSRAAADHAAALVVLTDTPGGYSSAMDKITTSLLNSRVPVIVYVSPAGARAASAGLFVAQAADLVAMAPSTNIGSAHPINGNGSNIGGDLRTKVVNDAVARVRNLAQIHGRNPDWCEQAVRESVNVGAEEAVRLQVADLVAPDLASLLTAVDGRSLHRPHATDLVLATGGASIADQPPSWLDDGLHSLVDPNIAYLLMLIAIYGLMAEMTTPGAILPGVAGGIAGILALVALTSLPVNLAGILLVGFAFLLFLADIKASTHGILTVGGTISLLAGSFILFEGGPYGFGVDRWLIVGVGLSSFIGFTFVVRKAIGARSSRRLGDAGALIGTLGEARQHLAPEGDVFVAGVTQRAVAVGGSIPAGTLVRVIGQQETVLMVEPVHQPEATQPESRVAQS
jgi:membrane-bound serine protease (ClpP class)